MTPEERAKVVAVCIMADVANQNMDAAMGEDVPDDAAEQFLARTTRDIASAIRAAVEAEREELRQAIQQLQDEWSTKAESLNAPDTSKQFNFLDGKATAASLISALILRRSNP